MPLLKVQTNPNRKELVVLLLVKDWICKKWTRLRLKAVEETVSVIVLIELLNLIRRKEKRRRTNRELKLINKI